jgi:hypothetical protein
MKLKFYGIIAISLSVLAFSGCGGSKPAPQKQAKVQQEVKFTIGKTTKSEVISKLGNPTGDSFNSKGEETLLYQNTHMTGKAFIPFYFGSDKVQVKVQQFTFKNDILTAQSIATSHY